MSQKLPIDGFEWIKNMSTFNKNFIKNYVKNSDKGCMLKVDVEYPENLCDSYNKRFTQHVPFLPERVKIKMPQVCMPSVQ